MDFRFYLTYNSVKTEISEPTGWDSLETSFKREKTHGIVFNFTINSLGFYGSAKEIILRALSRDGFNAMITFEVTWRCVSPKYVSFYTGRLSLTNGFDVSNDTVNCIIEQLDPVVLLNSRIDLKTDLLLNSTIGGISIPDAEIVNIRINGQELKAVTGGKVDIGGWTYNDLVEAAKDSEVNYLDGSKSRHGSIFPLLTSTSSDLGSLASNAGYDNSDAITFKLMYNGMFSNESIKIKDNRVTIKVKLKGEVKGDYYTSEHVEFRVSVGRDLGVTLPVGWNSICSGVTDFSEGVSFDKEIAFDVTLDPDLDRIIRVCVDYFLMDGFNGGELNIFFDEASYVKCECLTDYASTVDGENINYTHAKSLQAVEATKRLVSIITDKKLGVISSLSNDEIAGQLYLTSGKYLRNGSNVDGSTPAIQVSFKDLYNSLDSLLALGMGVKNGVLYVEKWGFFYQKSTTPITFEDISEVKRTIDNDRLISSIKIGYAKYSSDGQNAAEDCFADRTFSTILETTKNDVEKISKIVGSGYLIEDTRRNAATSDNSGSKYDEDIFFLAAKKPDERVVNLSFIDGIECSNGDKLITISDLFDGIEYPSGILQMWDDDVYNIQLVLMEQNGIPGTSTTITRILKAYKQRGYYFTGFYSAELSETNQFEFCIWLWSVKSRKFLRFPVFRANTQNSRWERVYSDYVGGYLVDVDYISDPQIPDYGKLGVFYISLQLTHGTSGHEYNYNFSKISITNNEEKTGIISFFDYLSLNGMNIPSTVVSDAESFGDSLIQTASAESYSGSSGETLINSTITPHANLRRWTNYLATINLGIATFPRIASFIGGTANYMAIVNGIAENSNIELGDISDVDLSSTPAPYIDTFDIPLSKDQYEIIKSNPYQSIRYSDIEGWIKECRYKIADGLASISVYPSLSTYKNLYADRCEKLRPINPEEKPDSDIVFVDRFDKWQNGMPYGWIKMNNTGSSMSPIGNQGVLLSGETTNFALYKRVIAIPSNNYSITIDLFAPLGADPFDGLSFIIGTRLSDQTKIFRLLPDVLKCQYTYSGEINHIKLSFMAARNKHYTAKVRSITIKKIGDNEN